MTTSPRATPSSAASRTELDSPIAILADLQGPKLRVGTFARGEEELTEGATFRLDLDEAEGDASRVCLPHPEIFAVLEPGAQLSGQ